MGQVAVLRSTPTLRGLKEGRKAHTSRVHKRSVMHRFRRFGGCDAPLAHDAFGLCALRKRVRVPAPVRQQAISTATAYLKSRLPVCSFASRPP